MKNRSLAAACLSLVMGLGVVVAGARRRHGRGSSPHRVRGGRQAQAPQDAAVHHQAGRHADQPPERHPGRHQPADHDGDQPLVQGLEDPDRELELRQLPVRRGAHGRSQAGCQRPAHHVPPALQRAGAGRRRPQPPEEPQRVRQRLAPRGPEEQAHHLRPLVPGPRRCHALEVLRVQQGRPEQAHRHEQLGQPDGRLAQRAVERPLHRGRQQDRLPRVHERLQADGARHPGRLRRLHRRQGVRLLLPGPVAAGHRHDDAQQGARATAR